MQESSFWNVALSRVLGTYAILIFALLWIGFGLALLVNPAWLNSVWTWVRALPPVAEILVWILFLPIMVALWAWQSSWPLLVRLLILAGPLPALAEEVARRSL